MCLRSLRLLPQPLARLLLSSGSPSKLLACLLRLPSICRSFRRRLWLPQLLKQPLPLPRLLLQQRQLRQLLKQPRLLIHTLPLLLIHTLPRCRV